MTAQLPDASSRQRVLVGLLIAALVNSAWLGLFLWSRHQGLAKPSVRSVVEMRLLDEANRKQQPPPARASNSIARDLIAARPSVPRPEELPEALTQPAPITATPTPQATASTVPLKLSLPPERAASGPRPESMLSQMLNDPRTNSPKRGVEYAVADGAGTLPVTALDSTDGTDSKVIRQGSKCTRVSKPRIATLNPMDPSTRDFLPAVGPCFKGG